MALIDTETLDQYQKSLDDEAHWLTEYAQDKEPKVGQCIINITVTMHRAAWALRELMKALPTIEPRRGKWIYNQKRGTMKIWTCSECGWNDIGEFNFCSNCGADMRQEEEQ